jgi:hypothetical protein
LRSSWRFFSEALCKGTAGIERGGRLSDARQFAARLAADITRLPGGGSNRSAVQR